jgi:putative inorganic carbon (hco3(-)) transporter
MDDTHHRGYGTDVRRQPATVGRPGGARRGNGARVIAEPAPALGSFRPRDGHGIPLNALVRLALLGILVGNLGRIPVFSTGQRDAAVLVNDLLVALLLCAGALHVARKRSLRLDSVCLLGLAFAVVGGASTLLSVPRFGLTGFEVLVSLGYLARWLFYFGTYVAAINMLRVGDVTPMWRSLERVLLLFSAFGILQALFLPNFAQMVYPESRVGADWDPQGHRLVSSWLDPVFAGAFIMLGLLIQIAQISIGQPVKRWKPALLAVALLLTASRAAILGMVAGIGVIFLVRGLSKRSLRITIALVVLLGALAPFVLRLTGLFAKLGVDTSALLRVVGWLRGLRVFADHPVIGIGLNAWGFVQERYGYERLYAFSYSLDGGLLFVAVMTGVVGLAFYVGMFVATLRRARGIWRDGEAPADHRALAIGVAAGSVAIVVDGFFVNSLFLPFLMEILWLLWAMVFVCRRQAPSHIVRRATTKKFVHTPGRIEAIALSSSS